MTDRPIIFSAPMVRALNEGRKTQTRRVLNPQPVWSDGGVVFNAAGGQDDYVEPHWVVEPKARFAVGDRLWVRESCFADELSRPPQKRPATKIERDRLKRTEVLIFDENDGADGVRYVADDAWVCIENTQAAGELWLDLFHYRGRREDKRGNIVPSIHMPRWASRLTLIVENVRVQRLHEISDDDAKAEGLMKLPASGRWVFSEGDQNFGLSYFNPVPAFALLWNMLHGPHAWLNNPWVAALTFRVIRANIDSAEVRA